MRVGQILRTQQSLHSRSDGTESSVASLDTFAARSRAASTMETCAVANASVIAR